MLIQFKICSDVMDKVSTQIYEMVFEFPSQSEVILKIRVPVRYFSIGDNILFFWNRASL